ncbi:unnamed protein product [Allacma fusca]|uniref:Pacifastin domain-containing protein n=1 Tax=Allacma fusca TaxID=39272 RepID=A0A8J2JG76_9HEXA|nr:unnamed protein product [Allacma fusca]
MSATNFIVVALILSMTFLASGDPNPKPQDIGFGLLPGFSSCNKGQVYKPDDCNRCICRGGKYFCTYLACLDAPISFDN